jgi:protein gp37
MHFAHRGLHEVYKGLTTIRSRRRDTRPDYASEHAELVDWVGEARPVPDRLTAPFSWSRQWVFVDSMSDLFHPSIPFSYIASVFGVMVEAESNVFVVLTKRIARAREFYRWAAEQWPRPGPEQTALQRSFFRLATGWPEGKTEPELWPPRNIIVGFSAATQATLERDLDVLEEIPAACRAVSFEPLLERIVIPFRERVPVGWAIIGGESGPGARPCTVEDAVRLARQCMVLRIPTFVKQLGAHPFVRIPDDPELPGVRGYTRLQLADPKGGDWDEWPDDVPRVRQTPEMRSLAGIPIAKLEWHR